MTVITGYGSGYCGKNFALPECHWSHRELFALGLMALSGLVTWVMLERGRWI